MSAKQSIDLDDGQRAAVEASVADATNVIAGAGTGKTSVLVERYVKLIGDGVPIERLLALTFTLKAAGEMRERVRRAVAERRPALVRHMSGAWIMNFHQFGYRFIKENAPALGIDPGVDVVSIAEFERIQRILRARFENGRVAGVPSDFGGEPPPPTKLGSLFDTLMKVALHCRGIMLEPQALRAMVTADDHPAYIARVDTVVALAREYEGELARRGLLDFSDMITIPARALHENPALGRAYGAAFDHILVDEFQDTSAAQNELLRALSGGNFSRVTVVGDKKQSIYRWRDARVENIGEFPDPDPRELTINYRSRQEILDLAHALVTGEEELRDAAVPLTAHRGAGEASVLLFHPTNGQERHDDEAEALGAWVDRLLGCVPAPAHWELEPMATPLEPHDIAVLLRRFASSKLMPAVERVFQRRGIPFAVVGGANRVEARALESWHAWLSLLLPGDRSVDLVAVLEAPPYTVTEASLAELFAAPTPAPGAAEWLREERIACVQNERDAAAMRDARASAEQAVDVWRARGFREFLVWSIESSPLRTRLLRDGAQPAAVDELLRELLDLADGLARRGELNLATFLDHLRASLDERKFHEDGDAVLPRERVAVMTVHQAKGLEFPAVAVVGVVDSTSRAEGFLVSREEGLYFGEKTGAPWKREKRLAKIHAREERMEDVEERCVLYVALTRARDHLWVSAPSVEGRKLLKGTTRPWLFTELVERARTLNLAREIREVGDVSSIAASSPRGEQENGNAEEALREWISLRDRSISTADALPAGGVVTVTWSDLTSFARCPLQFAFDRAGFGESEEAPPRRAAEASSALPKGIDAAEFGAFVHAGLEALASRPTASTGDVLAALSARFDFGKNTAEVVRAARARIEPVLVQLPFAVTTRAEMPFAVRVDTVLVQGVIDRLDDAVVTDYKVGERADEHAKQARVYAWAVDRARGESNATGRIAYLRDGSVDVVEVASPKTSAEIDRVAREIDAAIREGSFVATPGAVCAACPHRAGCEYAV